VRYAAAASSFSVRHARDVVHPGRSLRFGASDTQPGRRVARRDGPLFGPVTNNLILQPQNYANRARLDVTAGGVSNLLEKNARGVADRWYPTVIVWLP